MMLVQKYIGQQVLRPFILSLLALTTLALLTQSLQTIDLITKDNQSASTFFYITLLAMPKLIAIIMPISLFLSVLYSLNRIAMDGELIIAKAAGMSTWEICTPIVRISTLTFMLHLLINLLIQPLAFVEMRKEVFKVRTDIASKMVSSGEFIKLVEGLTIYAGDIGVDGFINDILINDARDVSKTITYVAEKGFISKNSKFTKLTLTSGSAQSLLSNGEFNIVQFDNYQLDLTEIKSLDAILIKKPSDLYLHQLLKPDSEQYISRKKRKKFLSEGNNRLASPLYNLALTLMAICAIIKSRHQRMGYKLKIFLCGVAGFSIKVIEFFIKSVSEDNSGLNIFQYAIPITICFLCIVYIFENRSPNRTKHIQRQKHNPDTMLRSKC
jgi:lipopolysaccharide export system permease protein